MKNHKPSVNYRDVTDISGMSYLCHVNRALITVTFNVGCLITEQRIIKQLEAQK